MNELLDMGSSTNYREIFAKNLFYTWGTRVGWLISKVGVHGVKWKLLGIETAVVKVFFSKIIILEDKF